MKGQETPVQNLAVMITDAILSDTFLNKEQILPRVEALIRAFVRTQNRPDYSRIVKPSKDAQRARALEKVEYEILFWKDTIRSIVTPEKMKEYYQALEDNKIRDYITSNATCKP